MLPPAEFAAAVAEPARVTINVHVPFEGTLDGTDLMIPYDEISEQASRLPTDRATPVAVYCRSGRMSADAVRSLVSLGYTDIVDLRGGMEAWRAEGRPVSVTPPAGG
ncbi:rhodanese-like domain-containing protein [Nocardia farcinica]|uniref:rhodanese-like domain-containing protein n=1 Tax=Nocardia farcinica TaxID=37329 RepID=UPI001E6451F9|nr:rhodanese-like domain-containing protein [Nocardia farcinica]